MKLGDRAVGMCSRAILCACSSYILLNRFGYTSFILLTKTRCFLLFLYSHQVLFSLSLVMPLHDTIAPGFFSSFALSTACGYRYDLCHIRDMGT